MQQEYNGFKEWLQTFELYRGKKTGDDLEDESRVVGTFKVSLQDASQSCNCLILTLHHANTVEQCGTLTLFGYWNMVCVYVCVCVCVCVCLCLSVCLYINF